MPPDLLISRYIFAIGNVVLKIDPQEQWIAELQAWFLKAMLLCRIMILKIAQNELEPDQSPLDPVREYTLYDLVLLLDADYTNINWIGLWATVASLVLICLASLFIPGH